MRKIDVAFMTRRECLAMLVAPALMKPGASAVKYVYSNGNRLVMRYDPGVHFERYSLLAITTAEAERRLRA